MAAIERATMGILGRGRGISGCVPSPVVSGRSGYFKLGCGMRSKKLKLPSKQTSRVRVWLDRGYRMTVSKLAMCVLRSMIFFSVNLSMVFLFWSFFY